MITALVVLLFIIIVGISAYLRKRTNGSYEIKITDMLLGIFPVIIVLVLSGNISELQVGDLSVTLKEDLKKKIVQETSLKNSTILDGKRSLILAVDCYYPIEDAIVSKNPMPGEIPYNYIIFQHNCTDDKNGNRRAQFWGIISFEDYREAFLIPYPEYKGETLISWIKAKNIYKLSTFPSFVTVDNAITLNTSKLMALEKMENLNVEFLPVVNDEKIFLGVITKQRLTSSLLLNIATSLN